MKLTEQEIAEFYNEKGNIEVMEGIRLHITYQCIYCGERFPDIREVNKHGNNCKFKKQATKRKCRECGSVLINNRCHKGTCKMYNEEV